jgi:hypothetical protein
MACARIFLSIAVTFGLTFARPPVDRVISETTARELVQDALTALGESERFQIDDWAFYWAPEFYTLSAFEGTGKRGFVIYYFAVNPWTGDVWDALACTQITSPALTKKQESIWARSGLPPDAREPLHDKSPNSCAIYMGKGAAKKNLK